MDPRPRCAVGGLKGPDFVIALQRQRNFVEPLQQAFAPSRINLEPVRLSGRRNDRLFLEIDPRRREGLLQGLDEVMLTLQRDNDIRAFQAADRAARPWIHFARKSA